MKVNHRERAREGGTWWRWLAPLLWGIPIILLAPISTPGCNPRPDFDDCGLFYPLPELFMAMSVVAAAIHLLVLVHRARKQKRLGAPPESGGPIHDS